MTNKNVEKVLKMNLINETMWDNYDFHFGSSNLCFSCEQFTARRVFVLFFSRPSLSLLCLQSRDIRTDRSWKVWSEIEEKQPLVYSFLLPAAAVVPWSLQWLVPLISLLQCNQLSCYPKKIKIKPKVNLCWIYVLRHCPFARHQCICIEL